jgi:deoxyribodipyrimidine photo-lyase
MTKRIVYWFRNDLRLQDNEAFLRATREADEVIPVYVFDPRAYESTDLGTKKTGVRRANFVIEAIKDLRENIRKKGGNLLIRIGKPEKIVAGLAESYDATYVFSSKEIAPEETSVESSLSKQLKSLNVDINLLWMDTLYHPHDLPFSIAKLPIAFTEFRNQIASKGTIRALLPSPASIQLPSEYDAGAMVELSDLGYTEDEIQVLHRTPSPVQGGETSGLLLLENILESENNERQFPALSPWLSTGCLSPRYIVDQFSSKNKEGISQKDQLMTELLKRDYHHFCMLKYGNRLFKPAGIAYDISKTWAKDKELFNQWKDGKTGNEQVNAIMSQLNITGYLSEAEKKQAASFLANELGVRWLWGASFFESTLLDDDVCVNWGNWNYYAGVGAQLD